MVPSTSYRTSSVALDLFGGGGGNAAGKTTLTYNGKKKAFAPGSPLKNAVAQLGVPVKYSCKKGDCATCQVQVAGRNVRACIGKVPPPPTLKSLQEKGLEIKA